jgi:selenocysteine lyase/cysteine desulfurase
MKKIIYFDNAATSWPKPLAVKEAMVKFIEEIGANPGRSDPRRWPHRHSGSRNS